MLTVAAVVLGLTILGGLGMLALRLRGGNPPLLFAIVHGLIAVTGVVCLLLAVVLDGVRGSPLVALFFFAAAAPLGLWFFSRHLRGKLIPVAGVLLHGMVAVFGYTVLLTHFF